MHLGEVERIRGIQHALDPQSAIRNIQAVSDSSQRDAQFADLAATVAEVNLDRAGDVLSRIRDPSVCAVAAAHAAFFVNTYSQAGSSSLFEEARRIAEGIRDPDDRFPVLRQIGEYWMRVDIQKGRALASEIGDPVSRVYMLSTVLAEALRRSDSTAAEIEQQALQEIGKIADPLFRQNLLYELARVVGYREPATAVRLLEDSRADIRQIKDPLSRFMQMVITGEELLKYDTAKGEETLREALRESSDVDPSRRERRDYTDRILNALYDLDLDAPLKRAATSSNSGWRYQLMAQAAAALARTDPARALAIARRIPSSSSCCRAEALLVAAVGLARTDPKLSDAVLDGISKADFKSDEYTVYHLVALLEDLAGQDPERGVLVGARLTRWLDYYAALSTVADGISTEGVRSHPQASRRAVSQLQSAFGPRAAGWQGRLEAQLRETPLLDNEPDTTADNLGGEAAGRVLAHLTAARVLRRTDPVHAQQELQAGHEGVQKVTDPSARILLLALLARRMMDISTF